jgi:hypothetical protein
MWIKFNSLVENVILGRYVERSFRVSGTYQSLLNYLATNPVIGQELLIVVCPETVVSCSWTARVMFLSQTRMGKDLTRRDGSPVRRFSESGAENSCRSELPADVFSNPASTPNPVK